MEEIESLKQSLKTEVNNRKETEEQFMVLVDEKTQDINKQLTLKYLNNMYQMREKLAQFETRKEALIEKLGGLSENVEKKLGDN